MIVVCTGCSAKFKVADEKVGPRGAKLRCSKCQTVFVVQRPELAASADPGGLLGAPPAPPPLGARTTTTAITALQGQTLTTELGPQADARPSFDIDLEPSVPRGRPVADPFAVAPPTDDPFASPAPALGAPPPVEDPFGAAPAGAHDPFGAAPHVDDPFALQRGPAATEALLGGAPAAADDPFASSGAAPVDPFAPALASDPFAAAPAPDPFAAPGAGLAGRDLALEDRTTPPPRPVRPESSAPLEDSFDLAGDAGAFDFAPADPGMAPGFGDLAGEPPPAPAHHEDPFAAAQAEPPAPIATAARLRALAVNAISLVALLAVAAGLLVAWRGGVPAAEALRPSRLLAALFPRDAAVGPFAAGEVTSGFYDRARGGPLLFVRGQVTARGETPATAVRVTVELVRDGQVLARGEALAGAVLSPEVLHDAADGAALARAQAALAPAPVGPGRAVPFLVAIADYPADLAGVALRVTAADRDAR